MVALKFQINLIESIRFNTKTNVEHDSWYLYSGKADDVHRF